MDLRRLTVIEQCPSFEHHVYRVEDSAKGHSSLYLKRYSHATAFRRETSALRSLSALDVPFLHPAIVDADAASWTVLLTAVPGVSMAQERVHRDLVWKLGETFRWLHVRVPFGELEQLSYTDDLEVFRMNILNAPVLAATEKHAYALLLERALRHFRQCCDPQAAVHGDANGSNVLHDHATGNIGLIDFERTHGGAPAVDLARIAWRIARGRIALVSSLLRGYYGRRMSPEEREAFRHARLYDLLGAVSYYAVSGFRNGYAFYEPAREQLLAWPR
jgi:aminoglycoside phosphotransferase (APT) family kinase protein